MRKGTKFSSASIEKQRLAKVGNKNPMFGRNHTEIAKNKVRLCKLADKNPNWKGDNIKSIQAIHNFVARRKFMPKLCENCFKERKLELANIKSHNYTRKIEDYHYLCRSCHLKLDRVQNV